MREILFRGKRIDSEEWVEGGYFGVDEDGDALHTFILTNCQTRDFTSEHSVFTGHKVDKKTVGQFTGLSDKNGKKIFEGDILLSRYEDKVEDSGYGSIYNEVAFTNGSFGMIGENTGDIIPFSEYPVTEEVVVGNIYDNPSLIQ